MPLNEAKISVLGQIRLLVAVPGANWESDFGMSLANMVRELGQRPMAGVKNHAFSIMNTKGSRLGTIRHQLADAAVESKSTHVLFLDTDHAFPAALAHVLISRRCDVIAVNCVTKTIPAIPTARDFDENDPAGKPIPIEADTEIPVRRVWRVGMGAMLINVDVFKRLEKPWFGQRWDPRVNDDVGEDWYFCEQLEKAGIPIYIDQQLSPLVTHIGRAHYHWEMQPKPTEQLQHESSIQVVKSLKEVGIGS